jgi:hypothetical protein
MPHALIPHLRNEPPSKGGGFFYARKRACVATVRTGLNTVEAAAPAVT